MKSAMNRQIHTPACYTLKMKCCNTKHSTRPTQTLKFHNIQLTQMQQH